MGAGESLFECLEQVPDPRRARGVRHPFQAILRLTLLGLVCGQTTMAHIALFARMHWPELKEPLGFHRDHPPHATTISRTLAGVPYEQLQGSLTEWVARVVADQELNASVDGKWAKQSKDAQGNPLMMVNVLAHDLKLCLAPVAGDGEAVRAGGVAGEVGPAVRGLPRPAAADYGRPVCGAGPVPSHSQPRTGLPGAGQGEPADGAVRPGGGVCRSGTGRAGGGDRRKKAGMIERRRIWADAELADYIREELGYPGARQGAMVEKQKVDITTGEVSRELWYLLTSLSSGQCGPRGLLKLFRDHWSIENSQHHVKDRSWDEDIHTLRRPGLGEAFATLVNTALNALRLQGWFPAQMSMPLRAKSCAFRPTQTIARLYGRTS